MMETDTERFERLLKETGAEANTMTFKHLTIDQLYKFFKKVEKDVERRKKPEQTKINDYSVVQDQIERSNISRYPYSSILGMSLTKYVMLSIEKGYNSTQTISRILRLKKVKDFMEKLSDKERFMEKLEISVCSRFSEEKSRGRL